MASLRIVSMNLLVDRADPESLRRTLSDVDAEVVVVQELGPRAERVIRSLYPHGHLDVRDDRFGLGIATKHPVDVEHLPLPKRPGWAARIEPGHWRGNGVPVDIVAVHLANPVDRPWSETRKMRRSQIEGVSSFVERRDAARVIVGDMNASPAWPEYKLLGQLGTDAAAATGTARRTWSHFQSGPRLLRIDHAFTFGVRPTATKTVPIRGSDHAGLVIDIEAP